MSNAGDFSWSWILKDFIQDQKEEGKCVVVCPRPPLNSSLVMSLGAGALTVSRGPNAISREEVSIATLEVETTPRAATNQHRHTE